MNSVKMSMARSVCGQSTPCRRATAPSALSRTRAKNNNHIAAGKLRYSRAIAARKQTQPLIRVTSSACSGIEGTRVSARFFRHRVISA